MGRATLAAVLDEVYAHRPPVRAQAILDAVQTANAGVKVPNVPMPDRIFRKGFYVEGVIYLAVKLAEALAHAHANGIFHRDLKPSNILLAPDGRPLLLDFNLSVDDRRPVWKVGGTLPYMAPEELSALCESRNGDGPPRYDPRSDLFSLGVIVYELLAGVLPFPVPCNRPLEEIAAQLRQRQVAGPRPLREHNRQIDKRLAQLIHRCLAVDPKLRPETATVLADALRRELTFYRRIRRWAAAHRRLVLAAVSIAMLAVLGTVAFFALRPPYSVRQFQQGLAWYEAGRDDLALQSLNASLTAEPRSSEVLAARARVYQREAKFQLAFADYDAVDGLTPSPSIEACAGYCLNRLGQDQSATAFYRRSLEAGYGPPAVLNNLGYSWLRLRRLDDAELCLRRALQADDTFQAPHHNLLLVFLRRAFEGKAVPGEAFVHARRALETGPESGELCRDLAFLHALAVGQDAAHAKQAIVFVAKAVAHGMDVETFRSDPAFSTLQNESAFQEALVLRAAVQGPAEANRVIDPTNNPHPQR